MARGRAAPVPSKAEKGQQQRERAGSARWGRAAARTRDRAAKQPSMLNAPLSAVVGGRTAVSSPIGHPAIRRATIGDAAIGTARDLYPANAATFQAGAAAAAAAPIVATGGDRRDTTYGK